MVEENKPLEPGAPATPGATEPTKIAPEIEKVLNERLAAQEVEFNKKLETVKLDEQKKFDRKNTELQKALKDVEEAKKAQMTAEQRADYERQEKERELLSREAALKAQELESYKNLKIAETGVPVDLAEFITGDSKELIDKRIENFMARFNAAASKEAEARMKAGGANPQNPGGLPQTSERQQLLNQITEAKKAGNGDLANKLQLRLESLPKT